MGDATTAPAVPTLATWMSPSASRWAFRHVRELIPSARIAAAAPEVLRQDPDPELMALRFTTPDGSVRSLEEHLAIIPVDALAVLSGDAFVLDWYAPGVAPTDQHIAFSVTKSITGLLAGALAADARLDLDADVVRYVPQLRHSGYGTATVRHLLDMSASICFEEDYSPGADMQRYRSSTGWSPERDSGGLHVFLCGLHAAGPHGQAFSYISPTIDALGWVCERAAGMRYADAVSRYLWRPAGAESDGEITVDPFGAPRAAGGLSATARDLARIGRLVRDGGRGVLPEWFVADLFEGGDPALWAAGSFAEFFPAGAYRSCWYQPVHGGDVVCAIGIHGQLLYVDRSAGVVAAVQSSRAQPDDDDADLATLAAVSAICEALAS